VLGVDGSMAIMDGRLEDAIEICNRIATRSKELGLGEFASTFVSLSLQPLIYLGRYDEILAAADYLPAYAKIVYQMIVKPVTQTESIEILDKLVIDRPGAGTSEDETMSTIDILFLEAAVCIGNHKVAEFLLRRLADSHTQTGGILALTSFDRHFGAAAALLGRYDEARKYYQEAIKFCTEIKLRPELALSRLQMAELLLDHFPDEKKEALEHLDFAIKEFREMKMQPSLERALRHKDILKA